MPQEQFYRYVSHPDELSATRRDRQIKSTNPKGGGQTWFTIMRETNINLIHTRLALPTRPRFRIGPVLRDEMPDFDICDARRVQPGYGSPGGGIEYCTTETVFLLGLYNLEYSHWEQL